MTQSLKRTLMFKDQELLEFELDLATSDVRILDAPDEGDALLPSLGFGGSGREVFVKRVIRERCMPGNREGLDQILDAFGAGSSLELAFMGHGLSLIDMLWYRKPGTAERWEDANFFDNGWDTAFGESVLTRDYKRLATCSPETPDVTTGGRVTKAWERTAEGICLVKGSLHERQMDFTGAGLAAQLCRRLFGDDAYQPLSIVERYGRRFTASPLMLLRDEELLQGYRLSAACGFGADEAELLADSITPDALADVFARTGALDVSARLAQLYAFKDLSLLADMHAGNFGVIRNADTGECRVAPPFDYDGSFGFPPADIPIETLCDNPRLAALLCAKSFSDLDPSWDWSWYDSHALDGFEECIEDAYAHNTELPPNFGALVARFFIIQRNYVNEVAASVCQGSGDLTFSRCLSFAP